MNSFFVKTKMYPILIKLGPIKVYTYGFFIALGCLIGFFYILKEAKRENIDTNKIQNLFFWVLISGFVGGRIFYCFSNWEYFISSPIKVFFGRTGFTFFTCPASALALTGFRFAIFSRTGSCPARRNVWGKRKSADESMTKKTIIKRFMIQLSNIGLLRYF